jgi:hypothetical protein
MLLYSEQPAVCTATPYPPVLHVGLLLLCLFSRSSSSSSLPCLMHLLRSSWRQPVTIRGSSTLHNDAPGLWPCCWLCLWQCDCEHPLVQAGADVGLTHVGRQAKGAGEGDRSAFTADYLHAWEEGRRGARGWRDRDIHCCKQALDKANRGQHTLPVRAYMHMHACPVLSSDALVRAYCSSHKLRTPGLAHCGGTSVLSSTSTSMPSLYDRQPKLQAIGLPRHTPGCRNCDIGYYAQLRCASQLTFPFCSCLDSLSLCPEMVSRPLLI